MPCLTPDLASVHTQASQQPVSHINSAVRVLIVEGPEAARFQCCLPCLPEHGSKSNTHQRATRSACQLPYRSAAAPAQLLIPVCSQA